MPPGALESILLPIAGMLTGIAVIGTIGWTIRYWVQRHYESTSGALGADAQQDVKRLEERVAALEELGGRMQDLEERLDFAERVLAQHRERGRLGNG
jgi:hypothetical protein